MKSFKRCFGFIGFKRVLVFALAQALVLTGCGRISQSEQINRAIKQAQTALNSSKCNEALDILSSLSNQERNVDYIVTRASALACRGNYSTVKLFADDLPRLNEGLANGVLGGLANFSTSSDMTTPDDPDFIYVQEGLWELLLPVGLTQSSHQERSSELSAWEVRSLETMAFYLTLVQLGRYVRFYGNGGDSGKGSGDPNANQCLMNYTEALAVSLFSLPPLSGDVGGCTSTSSGHLELNPSTDAGKLNACRGIILFNNFLDIFSNLSFLPEETATSLEDFSREVDGFIETCGNELGTSADSICLLTTQEACMGAGTSAEDIEVYFLLVFEQLFTNNPPP